MELPTWEQWVGFVLFLIVVSCIAGFIDACWEDRKRRRAIEQHTKTTTRLRDR